MKRPGSDRSQSASSSGSPSSGEVGLTVIVACLNAEETIATQLDALAAQVCPVSWELLICDNGSTDGTLAVVERYRDRLPVCAVDASARRGPGSARNVGAARARGRWLAFCDADDMVAEDWLAQMCAALERHAFVAGRFDGTRLNSRRVLRSRALDQRDGLQVSPDGAGLPHAGAGNMGVHTEVFGRVGGFDPVVPCLEDTDLSWRIQQLGHPLHYVPEVVVHVRLRSSLGGMYRQGVGYGRAYALLERRYGHPGVAHRRAGGAESSLVASTRQRGPVAVLRAWVGHHPSLGRFIWQLGWHRGYHTASRSESGTTPDELPGRVPSS